jgi:hypothetical protein
LTARLLAGALLIATLVTS